MFGCENVKPILNWHYAQIILPFLGLCKIMSYVFWQRSPVRCTSLLHVHQRQHTPGTQPGLQLTAMRLGKKMLCSSEKKNVYRCRQAQTHREKHILGTLLGNHHQSGSKPWDQGKFSSRLSSPQNTTYSSLGGRARQLHLLRVAKCYIRQCAHTVKSCTKGKTKHWSN